MRIRVFTFIAAGPLLFLYLPASGQASAGKQPNSRRQADVDKEPVAILEIGAASNWNIKGGATTSPQPCGRDTPIEGWLELEAGVSPFFTRKSTEWDTDLLFKSRGPSHGSQSPCWAIGPQWSCAKQDRNISNSTAGEVGGRFHLLANWQTPFLEPGYDYSFAGRHQQSICMSAGLLIGVGRGH